jgi:hypothetical protein
VSGERIVQLGISLVLEIEWAQSFSFNRGLKVARVFFLQLTSWNFPSKKHLGIPLIFLHVGIKCQYIRY